MPDTPILVTVIGGYLGAGKTTLVNHILRSANERMAVLVNDFGAINIDEALIESADGDTISLTNGCVCCSMIDGFAAALGRIRAFDPPPKRLVIEASGVADPSKVTPFAHGPGFALDAAVVGVDAEQIQAQIRNEYIGDVVVQQLRSADVIVLNKIDLLADLEAVHGAVGEYTSCPQVTAVDAHVSPSLLFGVDEDTSLRVPASDVDADARFATWTEVHEEPLDRVALEHRLHTLDATVIRVKGVARFSDSPDEQAVVQRVGERLAITPGGGWGGGPSTLVFVALRTGE